MSDKSIADRLFDAQIEVQVAEGGLEDLLNASIGEHWADYTYDYYDHSIEVYDVADVLPGWQEKLGAAGFHLVWLHDHRQDAPGPFPCPCAAVHVRPKPPVPSPSPVTP
jgi:hypothetical protein